MSNEEFTAEMTAQRNTIKLLVGKAARSIAATKAMLDPEVGSGVDKGEMIANQIIAMRHLEDAAMRFGKAIQAASGGVSPLGGPDTPNGGSFTPRPMSPMGGPSGVATAPAELRTIKHALDYTWASHV